MMKSTQPPRSPMKSLNPHENIPLPSPKKAKQLGIEAFTQRKRDNAIVDTSQNPRIKKAKYANGDSVSVTDGFKRLCHQCRQPVQSSLSVQCTAFKNKPSEVKRCAISYCNRCLLIRYDEEMNTILANNEDSQGHVHTEQYT